jgi:transcriptional regulator with XRE-family HTH domain
MASTRIGASRIELSPIGELLAHWRRERRMSQLGLSTEAGVTPRHVSFVESGRSHPSREMVLTLARALVSAPLPLLPVALSKDGTELSYFSLVTTVGTPQDVTLQELRVESFFPADETSEAHRWS